MEGARLMMRGRKLYLDKEHKKIAGVCAGIADYFDWDVKVVRIVAVIATFLWPPILICSYVILAWILDPKPTSVYGGYGDPRTADPFAPRRRLVDVKDRFDRLEGRLRAMETVVTSREFRIDRELRA
jgi:phage shock protein C